VKVVLSADASPMGKHDTFTRINGNGGLVRVLPSSSAPLRPPSTATQASIDPSTWRANKRARFPGPRREHRPREESLASGTHHAPCDRSAGLHAFDGDTESDDNIEAEVQRMDDYKHKTMNKDDDEGIDRLVDKAGGRIAPSSSGRSLAKMRARVSMAIPAGSFFVACSNVCMAKVV
jgi:hypothetical protein